MFFLLAVLALVPPALPFQKATDSDGASATTITCTITDPEGKRELAAGGKMKPGENLQYRIDKANGIRVVLLPADEKLDAPNGRIHAVAVVEKVPHKVQAPIHGQKIELTVGNTSAGDFFENVKKGYRLVCTLD